MKRYICIVIIMVFAVNIALLADGFIVVEPIRNNPEPFPLEVKYHHVEVEITDLLAKTKIDQIFYNPTGNQLEGYYLFPVPKRAVINDFSFYINNEETRAELLDSDKAREIYEDIVRRHLDPALLEYHGNSVYKVRIFPIEPGSEKRVKITYSESLHKDNGTIEYLYPLNTEKFSSKPLKSVSVKVDLKTQEELKNVFSPSHTVDVVRKNAKYAIVSYEDENVKPETDFKLYFSSANSDVGLSLITHRPDNEEGYFYLDINPGFIDKHDKIIDKDVTLILDTSGSMKGDKIIQAKKALLYCIDHLNKNDRFEIIRFSTEAESLFGKVQPVGKQSIADAKKFVKSFEPMGGTNIEHAFNLALSTKATKDRPNIIVFITDGKPTIGNTEESKLLKIIKKLNVDNTRVFTFGIGTEINTHLLDKITEVTSAYRSYISPDEDIDVKIASFFDKVQYPVLTDISLNLTGNIRLSKYYPGKLPDLFKGTSVNIIGRYRGSGKSSITIEGNINNKRHSYTYHVMFPGQEDSHEIVGVLWASRRIGFLLDQIRLNGESDELVEEVVHLSKKFGIMTPYTSYLVLEDEMGRTEREELDERTRIFNNMAPHDERVLEESETNYKKMRDKSGYDSVQASEELQELNMAKTMDQTRQGDDRLIYKDNEGNFVTMSNLSKNIQGRAFYQVNEFWIDSQVQDVVDYKVNRIQFATKAYFALMKKYPDIVEMLALGKNIRFMYNDVFYEIYE